MSFSFQNCELIFPGKCSRCGKGCIVHGTRPVLCVYCCTEDKVKKRTEAAERRANLARLREQERAAVEACVDFVVKEADDHCFYELTEPFKRCGICAACKCDKLVMNLDAARDAIRRAGGE